MSHTWDLQKFVEAHPENHEQRWRLTKHLYKDGDYRAALEHLQILTNEWEQKTSVVRYHAATLTRLNRPAEAVKLLEKAAREWPKDAEILEQLAMAYTRASDLEDAASIWGDIAAMVPDHKYARKAQEKLLREINPDNSGTSGSESETVLCSRCGAMNSPDKFECGSCHQRLDLIEDIVSHVDNETPANAPSIAILSWVKRGVLVLSLAFCVYSVLNTLDVREAATMDNYSVHVSWEDFSAKEFLPAHLILGVVLLIAWPLILRGAEVGAGLGGWFTLETAMTGATWALFALAVSFIPGVGIAGWCLAVLGVTLAGTWLEYRDRAAVGLRIWIAESLLIALVILIGLSAVIGVEFLGQLTSIDAFSKIDRSTTRLQVSGDLTEARTIRTSSSGSSWIDERASGFGLKVTVPADTVKREMTLRIVQDGKPILYESIVASEQHFDLNTIQPDVDATVELLGGDDVAATLELKGVLPIAEL